MARTGTFGRLPRALPSLTSTLVAIAREQESRRDQNIMDAWQKGGMFEGHKVTDSFMLAHWKERLNGISKDDPLYDTYKNAITQYEYSIAESKASTSYAQGKMSDSQMASFYINWSKKVPQDSEFYRILQRDAAQYMKAAKAKSDSERAKRMEEAYKAETGQIEKSKEQPGQFALKVLTMLTQQGANGRGGFMPETGMSSSSNTNVVENTNINQLQVGGIDQLVWLLSQVTPPKYPGRGGDFQDVPVGPATPAAYLYTDASGVKWTGQMIVDEMKKLDPSFDGNFDVQYIASQVQGQAAGIKQRLALARKTGHLTDAARLEGQLAQVNELGETVQAVPVMQKYADIKEKQEKIKADATLTPQARNAALNQTLADIGKLADDPTIANDGHLRSQLAGEATLQTGMTTVWEDMGGTRATGFQNDMVSGDTSKTSEIGSMKAMLELGQQTIDDINSGAALLTQGRWKAGVFIPIPGADQMGPATTEQLNALPNGDKARTVMIQNGDGSGFTPMMVVPQDITIVIKDPALKGKVSADPAKSSVLGQYITVPGPDGKPMRQYLVVNKETGATFLQSTPPVDLNLVPITFGQNGAQADISRVVAANMPKADAVAGDIPGTPVTVVNGITVTGRTPGTPSGSYETMMVKDPLTGAMTPTVDYSKPIYLPGSFDAGKVMLDPQAVAMGTEPTNLAGYTQGIDSYSPTMLYLRNIPDADVALNQFKNTKGANELLAMDAGMSAGGTLDPTTGGYTFTDPKAQAAYEQYNKWAGQDVSPSVPVVTPSSITDKDGRDSWWQDGMNTTPQGYGNSGPAAGPDAAKPLPTDSLRGAQDQRFAAMYNTTNPGSTTIQPYQPKTQDAFTISAGVGFKLPTYTPVNIPGPTAAGSSGSTAGVPSPTTTPTPTATLAQTNPTLPRGRGRVITT